MLWVRQRPGLKQQTQEALVMRTQNSRLTAKSGGTAFGGFFGGVGWTTALALIAIVAMIAIAAGCGTSEEEESFPGSSRSYQAEPTSTALVITGSSPTAAARYEEAMEDSAVDSSYSSSRSRRATPVPARPTPSRERITVVPGGPITFNDYLQSGWVWADQDNMSTFSLDTDRTSFALALNWAQSGYEIDPDSVAQKSG